MCHAQDMHISSNKLQDLARLVRYFIIRATTAAGSGHPSSSLSATDLMTTLFFGGFFHTRLKDPDHHLNDRLIFSKGHAAPLLYSLYTAAGAITEEELLTLRKFGSRIEGHPTMQFPWTEAATGSLGQGLSIGMGMAIHAKQEGLPYRTFVLVGDSELAEGSNWEAFQLAEYYQLNNLIAIIDVSRLGQRGETMVGHHVKVHEQRLKSFGWKTIMVDGHSIKHICKAYKQALKETKHPVAIIAKTIKGKGVSFIENKEGWHGRALTSDEAEKALQALGTVQNGLRGMVPQSVMDKKEQTLHSEIQAYNRHAKPHPVSGYTLGQMVATRKAYGQALVNIAPDFPQLVALDAETSNSTGAETFKKIYPDRFLEMFIAEQNMVGAALGLSRRGKIPFVSTFAAFLSRAHDQIRMSQYSNSNIKFVGSHAGVSIGEDGASQMALEDIAMFRSMLGSVVLYPSDAQSTDMLVRGAAEHHGNVYIRTTRRDTPVLYGPYEQFPIGGSKVLRSSTADVVTILGAGVTLHEALKAYDLLKAEGVTVRVIDLYSIKPLDVFTLERAARETQALVVVEDHFVEGGIAEAVRSSLSHSTVPLYSLAVRHIPQSGTSDQLLAFESIDATAIVTQVKAHLASYASLHRG